jgi:hypothetical protein
MVIRKKSNVYKIGSNILLLRYKSTVYDNIFNIVDIRWVILYQPGGYKLYMTPIHCANAQ